MAIMIKINKTVEPKTLSEYRSSIPKENINDRSIFNNYRDKNGNEECEDGSGKINLRKKLLEDQGYVCCYCLSGISCWSSKIEHFEPQSERRDKQIDYNNLFIACTGDFGGHRHCDTKKDDEFLKSINLLGDIFNHVLYDKSGRVYSENEEINKEMNDILGLNNKILKNNRFRAYSDMITQISKECSSGKWSKSLIQKYIGKYGNKKSDGKYAPYYAMLLFFLHKKMKKL